MSVRGEVVELCRLDGKQEFHLLSEMKAEKQIGQIGAQKRAVCERYQG